MVLQVHDHEILQKQTAKKGSNFVCMCGEVEYEEEEEEKDLVFATYILFKTNTGDCHVILDEMKTRRP